MVSNGLPSTAALNLGIAALQPTHLAYLKLAQYGLWQPTHQRDEEGPPLPPQGPQHARAVAGLGGVEEGVKGLPPAMHPYIYASKGA